MVEASRASGEAPDGTALEKAVRFRLAFQRNRLWAYGLAVTIGLASILAGTLRVDPLVGVAIAGTGAASALLLAGIVRRAAAKGVSFDPVPFGTVLDPLLISAGVAVSGGLASSWYLWYLAAIAPAAFTRGRAATAGAALYSCACYVGALTVIGDVRGPGPNLAEALTRMVFLGGAAALFLFGVATLQEKQATIRRLKEGESRKVEELRRLAASLDAATREIASAADRVREADRMKSRFLANMSHELRTPLNSIIGFSEVLRTRLEGRIEPKPMRFLEHIHTSGQHLLGLINDILDLSKIEAGRMELQPEPVAVRSLIEGVCHVIRGIAGKASVAVEIVVPEDLPPLEADPVKLKQVLFNLLSNAVKFSPAGSTVTVSARAIEAGETRLATPAIEIAVADRGVGIAPEDHAAVFEEFRQAESGAARRYEGTGLGLALVKRLVEAHRGSVSLMSAPGEGSVFTVRVPLHWAGPREAVEEAASATATEGESAAPGPRLRILVVEDDTAAWEGLARLLAGAGYIPLRARSGEEAVMLARELHPDAITLDIVLPGLDGWDVLRTLKLDPGTAPIPVVVVSVAGNRELGLTLGAADYFLKPVDRKLLLSRLSELLAGVSRAEATVLVVDDDPAVHELLDGILLPEGWETTHAAGGAEALARIRGQRPALVILDLMMDGMDGFEVAERLAADPETSAVPVVVLTARDLSREDRVRLSGKVAGLVPKGDRGDMGVRLKAALARAVRTRPDGGRSND